MQAERWEQQQQAVGERALYKSRFLSKISLDLLDALYTKEYKKEKNVA